MSQDSSGHTGCKRVDIVDVTRIVVVIALGALGGALLGWWFGGVAIGIGVGVLVSVVFHVIHVLDVRTGRRRKDLAIVKGTMGCIVICVPGGAVLGWWFGDIGVGLLLGIVISLVLGAFNAWMVWAGELYRLSASAKLSPSGEPPRNHIICIDGTWNAPDIPTSVDKFYQLLLRGDEKRQIARYYNGVGARENVGVGLEFLKKNYSRTPVGGAIGYGATAILREAYFHFVKDYRPGDRIFIFGFSRGAAIARKLANYICSTYGVPGSVDVEYLSSSFLGMRAQKDTLVGFDVTEPQKWGTCEVELLGLWDTVTAFVQGWSFEDLRLPPGVKKAYHLVAIDEIRKAFDVALIDQDDRQDDRVEEIWFAGAHSNVGGGLKDCTLSNIALRFMVNRAFELRIHFCNDKLQAFQKEVVDVTKTKIDVTKAIWKPGLLWGPKITRQIRVQGGAPGVVPWIHGSVITLKDSGKGHVWKNVEALREAYKLEERD